MKFITMKYRPQLIWGVIGLVVLGLGVVGVGNIKKGVSPEQTVIVEPKSTSQVPATEVSKIKMHVVQDGETLSAIAATYNIDVATLQGANDNLKEEIHQGDQLVILPSKGVLHKADMGDTLWQMANLYGVAVDVIMNANGKTDEELAIGENIFVPGGKKPQQVERQVARADESVSRGSSERFVWPTAGELSSSFGYRWGRLHAGIDLANDTGTVVRASRAGRVTHAGWYSGYGNTVIIEHDQGYVTLYGHLSQLIVEDNQYVKGGQMIAYMGNTGNSTGSHLHFEVRKNGTPINPYNVLP